MFRYPHIHGSTDSKMKTLRCLETSGSDNALTQCHHWGPQSPGTRLRKLRNFFAGFIPSPFPNISFSGKTLLRGRSAFFVVTCAQLSLRLLRRRSWAVHEKCVTIKVAGIVATFKMYIERNLRVSWSVFGGVNMTWNSIWYSSVSPVVQGKGT
jgi:hypothetical protein